jgi:glycosyltransferase involved in cell wall biosynthesis
MLGGGFGGIGRVSANKPDPKLGIIVHRKINIKRITSPPQKEEPPRPSRQPPSGIGIRFVAPFLDGSGYGEGARNWLAALRTAGVDVLAEPVSFDDSRTDYGLAGKLTKEAIGRKIDCKISMIYLTPDMYPLHRKESHYNIGLFEWETDRIPSKWVYECNAMDEIWVCSHWVADVARAEGVKKPIHVFGHCVNPAEYAGIRALEFPELPKNCFKFYSIFQWTERKNPRGLLQAYLTAFRKKDPVILILKTYRANYSIDEQQGVLDEIENIKQEIGGNQPRILFIPEMLSRQEILSLHATGDCFVLPHRSEGWGLPHFDACAMGKPVITTRFGGNLEFMTDDTAFLVDFELIPVKGMAWIPWYTEDMSWANPDLGQCRKYMRYIYANQMDATKKGAKTRQRIFSKFNWESIGISMKQRLESLQLNDGEIR